MNRASAFRETLIKLHRGDSITDVELNIAIQEIETLERVFAGLSIPSMPEYSTFYKALMQDYRILRSFQVARMS